MEYISSVFRFNKVYIFFRKLCKEVRIVVILIVQLCADNFNKIGENEGLKSANVEYSQGE